MQNILKRIFKKRFESDEVKEKLIVSKMERNGYKAKFDNGKWFVKKGNKTNISSNLFDIYELILPMLKD